MNTTYEKQTKNPYSARNMAKPVNFYFPPTDARSVNLTGDFNDWDESSLPMQLRDDGWWFLQVQLTHGHHLYQFVVDGEHTLDPRGAGVVTNERGEEVSIVAVS